MFRLHHFTGKAILMILCLAVTAPSLYAQGPVSVKFSVDMGLLINQGKFNQTTDRVFLRGSFNNWESQTRLNQEGTSAIYSITVALAQNTYHEYLFFINSSGAANGGWESKPGIGNNGNRTLNTGTSQLVLPVVIFNNADMFLKLSNDHFNFYCTAQDSSIIKYFSNKLETEYQGIVTALAAQITQKIDVKIYKNEVFYHNAMGYPEFPAWAVGSAVGKTTILMASPNHAGSHTYTEMLQIVVHEFTHIVEAWKTTVNLAVWLNEGVAMWFAGQKTTRADVLAYLNQLGHKPTLADLENSSTFSDIGGYQFSNTIVEFIVKTTDTAKLASFVGNMSYSNLGYANKTAFQSAWHKYLDDYYINTPPPVMVLGTIRRFGENWIFNYTPHQATDADNNTLTYSILVTGDHFDKTYTDTNHSGTFTIPKSEFENNTTYSVLGKSYDGIVYTYSNTRKTFNTTDIPPTKFTFTQPVAGNIASFTPEHQLRIAWTPVQVVDSDGDSVTDTITITGNGLLKTVAVGGGNGFILVDSSDFKPGKTYTVQGKRSDGLVVVPADPITFIAPGVDGIDLVSDEARIRVFPVPTDRFVTLESDFLKPAELTIEVISAQSQSVYKTQLPVMGSFKRTIDLGSCSPGIYFVHLIIQSNQKSSVSQVRIILTK